VQRQHSERKLVRHRRLGQPTLGRAWPGCESNRLSLTACAPIAREIGLRRPSSDATSSTVNMTPSEHHERHETQDALQRVFEYISPGTNEGISFSLSRSRTTCSSTRSWPEATSRSSLPRAIPGRSRASPRTGVRVLFSGETTSEDAVYSLALVLI
jgi:hypothetical protein